MLRFFSKFLCIAASLLLLAACSKQSSNTNQNFPHNTFQDTSSQEDIPVLDRSDRLSNSAKESSSFESIKRFSYESFTRKNVQLTQSLDFPVPINFSLHATQKEPPNTLHTQGSYLSYEGNLSLKKTILFYGKQLKASGWSYKNLSTSNEGLLICSSKQYQVVVSIRRIHDQSNKKTLILLFFDKNT